MRRPLLLTAMIAAVLASALPAPGQQADPASPPCSSDEYRQFDFWLGDWVVTAEDGQALGTNRIEKTLNDCVITESWQGAGGSIGKSFNMYFSRDEQWHQTWVDGQGRRLDLTGGLVEGSMVLSGTMPDADGEAVLHEISWTPQGDGTVRQRWRASKDDGTSWTDLFVGVYSRKPGH